MHPDDPMRRERFLDAFAAAYLATRAAHRLADAPVLAGDAVARAEESWHAYRAALAPAPDPADPCPTCGLPAMHDIETLPPVA
jgi:hypothetical protein